MKQILIIDDDENLGELLTQYLARYEMQAHVALAPSKGLEMIKKLKPDLLILDVMLPEKDGFEVCREIRAKSSIYGQLPILMLTAHAEVTDRIVGLEQTDRSQLIYEYEYHHRTALVIGHERHGMNAEELALVDDVIEIPVYGMPYSYNVVTATTMAVYEYLRQFPQG